MWDSYNFVNNFLRHFWGFFFTFSLCTLRSQELYIIFPFHRDHLRSCTNMMAIISAFYLYCLCGVNMLYDIINHLLWSFFLMVGNQIFMLCIHLWTSSKYFNTCISNLSGYILILSTLCFQKRYKIWGFMTNYALETSFME